MKKMILTLAAATSLFLLTACNDTTTTSSSSDKTTTSESVDLTSLELPQLSTEVKENEDLVALETTEGTIKIKLFPEIAPKAVENFMTHAKIQRAHQPRKSSLYCSKP